jgi:hypothetical protein
MQGKRQRCSRVVRSQVADADEEGERRTSILGVEAGRPTCKWKGTMRARMALVRRTYCTGTPSSTPT